MFEIFHYFLDFSHILFLFLRQHTSRQALSQSHAQGMCHLEGAQSPTSRKWAGGSLGLLLAVTTCTSLSPSDI